MGSVLHACILDRAPSASVPPTRGVSRLPARTVVHGHEHARAHPCPVALNRRATPARGMHP
jgi:hypothetical protein